MRTSRRTAISRALLGFLLVLAILAAAYFMPLPSIGQARTWADSLGSGFLWVFFVAYAILTIAPLPRSTLTVASGVLFGPVVGLIGSLLASAVAAMFAFFLARRLGRERVQPLLARPVVATIEQRLERRGWLAVGSLRLIPAAPFAVVNYLSGVSSIRPLPFLLATVIGSAPGTAAVVFLGDALTGEAHPAMFAMSASLFALGVFGLLLDARLPVKPQKLTSP